jgi:hypothetical protein
MDNFLNSHQWGGSGIERVTFDEIRKLIPEGSTIVELGSGRCSTLAFSKIYNLFSVDHNKDWQVYENINYIHAPLVDGWYDIEILKKELPPKKDQKLIFIDGVWREGLLKNIKLFNPKGTFIVHDTYRDAEKNLAEDIAKALKRKVTYFDKGDYFAII